MYVALGFVPVVFMVVPVDMEQKPRGPNKKKSVEKRYGSYFVKSLVDPLLDAAAAVELLGVVAPQYRLNRCYLPETVRGQIDGSPWLGAL